ncbi:unnamed protein product [Brachionus calyciflorus]|uniref:RRM domain-containing protein n=1 Tax=Brachionus calyciflorus TaxID=104777 RepID=A0A814FDY1_9BILA|nr:unnamed protein product [Brachionus calyciflorus]
MGKKSDLFESSRLSYPKNQNFDARFKLNRNQIDARNLLNKKQQKDQLKQILNISSRSESYISKSKKDPLVIITGLGNVRKDSSGIKVIKSPEHRVITKGSNTMITVKNNSSNHEINIKNDRDSKKSSYEPIKISIDNDLALKGRDSFQKELHIRKSSLRYHENDNYDRDEQMDFESSNSRDQRSTYSTIHQSFDIHSNGFKLYISNLHPRVTEDDILELFGDIGPIKRARFLERGLAEVIYLKLEDAKEAIRKYDRNELDGRPMRIELVHSSGKSIRDYLKPKRSDDNKDDAFDSFKISKSPKRDESNNSISNRFKSVNLSKGGETTQFHLPDSKRTTEIRTSKVPVDSSIIHQVLFNKKASNSSNPVTFTVKL